MAPQLEHMALIRVGVTGGFDSSTVTVGGTTIDARTGGGTNDVGGDSVESRGDCSSTSSLVLGESMDNDEPPV